MNDVDWDSDESLHDAAMRVSDELAVWRRHGVLITEDCGECADGLMCDHQGPHDHDVGCRCPVCDGSGKVLKDGAEPTFGAERPGVWFPASWLEGASDGN